MQYYNTLIIILFTYLVGIVIAFLTKQIDYNKTNQVLLVGVISIAAISLITIFMLRVRENLKEIPEQVKQLEL